MINPFENVNGHRNETTCAYALANIYPMENHPFKVKDDEDMEALVESIRQYGVLNPIIVRKRTTGGGYEIVSSHRRYEACKRLNKFDIPVIVRDLTDEEATLEKFYAQLKANGRLVKRDIYGPGLANSVIRSIHAHCRAALDKAVAEKLIRQNPAIGRKLPPKKTPEVKILTPEAMQKLLYQAQIEGFYEMFMLDLATGLRRGEVVGLQWKDIDLENGTLSVTRQVRYVKGELKIEPPKTKASERSIILSPPVLEMLTEYKKTVNSIWLFPSPVKIEDVPRDPSACRKALARILKRAECEHVPFHAMRHTFASNAFHYGMDVKTLASTIGHESVETTLNVYAHSSEQMKRDAAKKIDEAIGTVLGADVTASDAYCGDGNGEAQERTSNADKPKTVEFKPYQPKYRKRGTGSVHQVSKNVWEGRYTPTVNGKRVARNIYADSEEECEVKLEELIKEMKAEFEIK